MGFALRRRWEMGDGRWEMGDGRWEMGRRNNWDLLWGSYDPRRDGLPELACPTDGPCGLTQGLVIQGDEGRLRGWFGY